MNSHPQDIADTLVSDTESICIILNASYQLMKLRTIFHRGMTSMRLPGQTFVAIFWWVRIFVWAVVQPAFAVDVVDVWKMGWCYC